ncbi:MAG TPA: PQQ-binding-like beta-propeller repeat protein, partial [Blastocatellia bacterium]|nr:PQQ-binding-like beta-propeller repeat protein [Blastocatellia bacterium]
MQTRNALPVAISLSYRIVLSIAVFGFLICHAVFWAGNVSSASVAQADGLFTAAQAARGGAVYAKRCAECHGQNLEGTTSTALTGARFTSKWADGKHTVDDLYFVTRTQMPYGAPATLTNQQYIDVVAFMLQSNGYRAGSKEMTATSASLKATTISSQSGSGKPDMASKVEVVAPSAEPVSNAARPVNGKPTQAELNAAAGTTEWLMSNHDYGGQRFVDLKQITPQNVASLRPVAMYQAVDTNPFHTNPVVSGGLMYITVNDSTIALDAATLQVKWRNNRKPKGKEGWRLNRGVAIKDGLVVRGTHDGYLVAMDAATGKIAWERALVDMTKHEGGFTMAPVV